MIPDEEYVGDILNVGARKSDEIGSGEIVRDGDDKKRSGARTRVWEGALRGLPIEVNDPSPFAEFRVRV